MATIDPITGMPSSNVQMPQAGNVVPPTLSASTKAYTGYTSASSPATVTTTPVISSQPAIEQVSKMTNTANQSQSQIDLAAQQKRDQAAIDAAAKAKLPAKAEKPALTPEQYAMSLPDEGNQFIYNSATGQETQIKLGSPIPSGFTSIDVKTAPAAETTTSSDNEITFKKLPDGSYGKYDTASGEYLGMSNAQQFADMKAGQSTAKAYRDALASGPLLNENQKAQIEAVRATYQRMIDTQSTANANIQGSTALAQNLYGFAGTDMANKALQGEAEKGAAKIAELNSRMNADVAKMTLALQSDNMAELKDAYQSFQVNSQSLQKNIDTQQARAQATADKIRQQIETRENAIDNDARTLIGYARGVATPEQLQEASMALDNHDLVGVMKALGDSTRERSPAGKEYDDYVAKAEAAGVVPMGWNEYQTADANRKAKVAAAGATRMGGTTGLTKDQLSAIKDINRVVMSSPIYKTAESAVTFADSVTSSLNNITGVGDLGGINQFQKVIDEGAVTRDQDVKLIIGAQPIVDRWKAWQARNLKTGEITSPELRQQMKDVVDGLAKVKYERLMKSPAVASQMSMARNSGIKEEDTVLGNLSLLGQSVSVADEHIQSAKSFETNLAAMKTTNPKLFKVVSEKYTSINPKTKQPYTHDEILQAFPELK